MKCKNDLCNNDIPLIQKFDKKNNKYYNYQATECETCRQLRMKYGITTPDRDLLLHKQNYECAICTSPISFQGKGGAADKHSAVVDHCHTDGHIRGILCGSCNIVLGRVNDSIDLLEAAKNYLTKPTEKKTK